MVVFRRAGREDIEATKDVNRQLVKRVWRFTRNYRARILTFVFMIMVSAVLGIVPLLLFKRIIDHAIPEATTGEVTVLALITVAVAVATAGLDIAQRWYSAGIGEGLIYDLRVAVRPRAAHADRLLHPHADRRADQPHEQRRHRRPAGGHRHARQRWSSATSSRSPSTLGAMFVLEWRLTLLPWSCCRCSSSRPTGSGARLQAITREGMRAQRGDEHHDDRALQRVRRAAGEAVRPPRRRGRRRSRGRAGRVRDIGVTQRDVRPRRSSSRSALVAAVGTAVVYWSAAGMVIAGTITVGTLGRAGRASSPASTAAHAAHQRPRRRADRARVASSGSSRCSTSPRADHRAARRRSTSSTRRAASSSTTSGSATRPRREVSLASLEGDGQRRCSTPRRRLGAARRQLHASSPAQLVALVGPSGAGKTTAAHARPAALRRRRRARSASTATTCATSRWTSLRGAIGVVTQDPHLFHDTIRANLRYARPDATDAELVAACRGGADPRRRSPRCPTATTPSSASAATACRAARSSASPSPACCSRTRRSSSSTRRRRHLDSESERAIQQALAAALAGRTSIVIAHRLSTIVGRRPDPRGRRGAIVERGTHAELLAAGGLYAELYRILIHEAPTVP